MYKRQKWNKEKNELKIDLKQTQDQSKNPVYRLPMDVDFYFGSAIEKKRIVMDSLIQSFTFSFPEEPLLVNVDAEKMLLIEKKLDHKNNTCLLYTSDAADERSSVDLGGRRIIKKKKQ